MSKAKVLILSSVNMDTVNDIIPGKLFYYFSFKRPIIAFSKLNSDVSDIISRTNTGKVFDYSNEIELKKNILELYSNYKTKKNNFKPKGIELFTYNNLSKNLNILLKKTIK